MNEKTASEADNCAGEGPQSSMERKYVEEYLQEKGYSLRKLQTLPEEQAKALMREACRYASLKLAEVEAKVKFGKSIKYNP